MKKRVLITGAGRGLGRALAEEFHRNGWEIVASDISSGLLAELEGVEGYLPIVMDVTSDESVQRAFETVRESCPSLDLIIDNAGIDIYFPLSEAPVGHLKRIFEVNFFGACRVNQVFLPLLKKQGGILAIGSESLYLAAPFLSYPITKRALETYILGLRQELWYSGRWATVVRCGPIRTGIVENLSGLQSEVSGTSLDPVFARFASSVTKEVGKVMEPGEIAARIYKIACNPHPGGIYKINNRFVLRMLKWIPFGIMEKAVRKKLALQKR